LLASEVVPRNDPLKAPFKAPTKATEWLVVLGILLLCFALSYLIGEARGWVIGVSVGAFAFLILFAWPLRREGWFWLLVAIFGILHAAAVSQFDWSWVATERNGLKGLAAFFTPDLLIMCGITYGIYRLKYGMPALSIEPSIDDLPRYADRDLGS
jgi:uncharacterized membrane protein YjjP (DUF1212 family)